MTVTMGSQLPVEGSVSKDYDIGKKQGYMVSKSVTIEGTPTEKVIMEGIRDSIKEVGDLPIYVNVTLTWSGKLWPWTQPVSKFDVEYQAVHMAEDSLLMAVAAAILYALPYVAKILLVLLGWKVVDYFILKVEDVGEWLDKYGPQVATGFGVGVVLLAALALSGDDKK